MWGFDDNKHKCNGLLGCLWCAVQTGSRMVFGIFPHCLVNNVWEQVLEQFMGSTSEHYFRTVLEKVLKSSWLASWSLPYSHRISWEIRSHFRGLKWIFIRFMPHFFYYACFACVWVFFQISSSQGQLHVIRRWSWGPKWSRKFAKDAQKDPT